MLPASGTIRVMYHRCRSRLAVSHHAWKECRADPDHGGAALYHGICNHSQESSSSRAPAGVDKDRGEIPCMDVRIILLTMRLMMLVAADRGENKRPRAVEHFRL